MTNPNESAHDEATGAPAEGVTLNEGQTVDAPNGVMAVSVDESKVYGYHAESHSLVDPYQGDDVTHDGKDGWKPVHVAQGEVDGGNFDKALGVTVFDVKNEDES